VAIEAVSRLWNDAVGLKHPVHLDALRRIASPRQLESVYDNVETWLYAGSNVAIRLPLAAAVRTTGLVQAVVLSVSSDLFAAHSRVRTTEIVGLRILGIPIPLSAADFLDALRARGARGLTLTTEPDRWTLVYGDALIFEFRANEPHVADPRRSRMVAIEFSYGLPYTGALPPTVSEPVP
jgi:hypothetical protein